MLDPLLQGASLLFTYENISVYLYSEWECIYYGIKAVLMVKLANLTLTLPFLPIRVNKNAHSA